MRILGVNWDHPSGACLLEGGHVVAAVSEERFSRAKNDVSFPRMAIDYCLGLTGTKIVPDAVCVVSLQARYVSALTQYVTNFSVADKIREQREVWHPRLYEGRDATLIGAFPDKVVNDQYPPEYWREYDPAKESTYPEDSLRMIAAHAGVGPAKAKRVEHHSCHAYYGYYASPFRGEKALVLTVDGIGDGLNATISVADGKSPLKRIYSTDKCVLGRVYRHVTLLLGMKPLEHEYKVMGLAPYAHAKQARPAFEVFNDVLKLDGINFEWKNKPRDSYFHFRERLEGMRFDHVAAGMQMWVEDVLTRWVENAVKHTGIDTVVISGGVAMNVKAMGKIAALPAVRRFFVPGSSSDDSNCIGAALVTAEELSGGKFTKLPQVSSLYLGNDAAGDAEETFQFAAMDPALTVERGPSADRVAKLLERGLIVARCVGRMEFGQRSLGNRSILADPRRLETVPRLNAAVKSRDFWMPFAPAVLDTYAGRYLVNPKGVTSPHMTIGYETTAEGWRDLRAACHAADRSARAQILTREANPEFYELIEAFAGKTGVGGLLNTSFNLHGYPIVSSCRDAYDVFLKTEIDALELPGGLIVKRPSA